MVELTWSNLETKPTSFNIMRLRLFFLPPSQTEVMNGAKTNTLFRACSTECGNPVKLC